MLVLLVAEIGLLKLGVMVAANPLSSVALKLGLDIIFIAPTFVLSFLSKLILVGFSAGFPPLGYSLKSIGSAARALGSPFTFTFTSGREARYL